MDIFTTALAQIRVTPIKPESLKVKALRKEQAMGKLTDDTYHLENHQLYFIDEKTHQQRRAKQEKEQQQSELQAEKLADDVQATEDVIIHKQDILHPEHKKHDDDEDIKHLDIFI